MQSNKLVLSVLKPKLAICRLALDDNIPDWALVENNFFSITRTIEELSIVCNQILVPPGIKSENDWRAFKVEGPLDFALTGILSNLLQPLANAKISIFAVSTFDTDYILVKENNLDTAIKVLSEQCTIKHIA